MLLGLKVFVEPHDVLVASLFQAEDLLHDFLGLGIFREVGLVDRLDGCQVLRQVVQSQIYLSERSLTEDLSNSVEIYRGSWGRSLLLKALFDVADQFAFYLCTGRETWIICDRVLSVDALVDWVGYRNWLRARFKY